MGEAPPRGITFKVPGAMHHARWMSKAIYCLKMYIFKSQFILTAQETEGLRHICAFIVGFYVKAWFTAPNAVSAPYNDLTLLQKFIQYEHVNAAVSKAAQEKLAAHLWYLSEENVALAFFDENVPLNVKVRMADAIKRRDSVSKSSKRVVPNKKELLSWVDKSIEQFVTRRSLFFRAFRYLGRIPRYKS